MSREIRFRIYDKKRKSYIGDENGFTLQSLVLAPCDETVDNIEDYIFEQYTGLKDKNGKEIYEGDIVKWYYGLREFIFRVEWQDNYAKFNLRNEHSVLDYEDLDNKDEPYLEVIGNIHENPELLEDGK